MTLYIKKILIWLSLSGLGILFANSVIAQTDSQIQNELQRLYENPEELYRLKQESLSIGREIETKKSAVVAKKDELSELLRANKKQDEALQTYREQLTTLRSKNPEVNATRQGRKEGKCSFSVQIGAYKNKDLTQYMESNPNFLVEVDSNGFKKYLLGYFTSYWEALSFSKHLNQNGAQSYVAGFLWGKRIPDLKDMTECIF